MILVWMAYATVVSALAGLAALVAEPIIRGRGAAIRFLWLGSIALSVALPAWAILAPPPPPAGAGDPSGVLLTDVGASLREIGRSVPPLIHRLDGAAAVAWGVASTLLGLALLGGLLRLAARARRWPRARVAGDDVLLSTDFGPAAFGWRVPRVVLPAWTLRLHPEQLRLVIEHEREHGRAGDARLLLVGAAAFVMAPWNPALWWQLRRLRAAVEIDCDRRVLRGGAAPSAYARVLLELGARSWEAPYAVPGLARPRSLLERRMTMIVRGARRTGALATTSGAIAAGLLLVAACEAPAPTAVRPTSEEAVSGSLRVSPEAMQLEEVTERTAGRDPVLYLDGVLVERLPEGIVPDGIARVEVVKGGAVLTPAGEAERGVVRVFTKKAIVHVPPTEARVFVDGEPYGGDLRELSTDNIERVDVVKGPDGPGEIRITLKKAGRGR